MLGGGNERQALVNPVIMRGRETLIHSGVLRGEAGTFGGLSVPNAFATQ